MHDTMIIGKSATGHGTPRLVVNDEKQQKKIVSMIHDEQHLGINRTTEMVCTKYYWPRMTKDIMSYVSQCM